MAEAVNAAGKPWGEVAIGIGTVLFAAIAGWQSSLIASEGVGSSVGPDVGPWVVSAMLALFGAALAGESLLRGSGGTGDVADDHGPIDLRDAGWMILGLLINVALIEYAGFIIASTLLFVCTARAFGSANVAKDAGIGLVLALVAYIGFDRLLGYKIGSGLIERFI